MSKSGSPKENLRITEGKLISSSNKMKPQLNTSKKTQTTRAGSKKHLKNELKSSNKS